MFGTLASMNLNEQSTICQSFEGPEKKLRPKAQLFKSGGLCPGGTSSKARASSQENVTWLRPFRDKFLIGEDLYL